MSRVRVAMQLVFLDAHLTKNFGLYPKNYVH
jgi:hypothetical protein